MNDDQKINIDKNNNKNKFQGKKTVNLTTD